MGSKAVDEEAHLQAETTSSMESLHTNKNNNTTTLPSPPSVKATESDSGRNENGLHLVEVVGGELTVSGNFASAPKGANAGMKNTATLVGLQVDHWNS